MGIEIQGRVGAAIANDGAVDTARIGATGELMTSQLQARHYENVYRGNVFIAHNTAAQAISVALATTYTGLCLSNPANSGKNLVILAAGLALSVAPAAIASIHIIGAYSGTQVTHTTPLASPGIQNALLGGPQNSVAKVDSAATIPAPGYILPLMGGFTAAALPAPPRTLVPIDGQIIVPPSAFVCIGALTAVTGFSSFVWAEVPV